MSLADRFGGGLPRGWAPGNQALERLLGELGLAGAQLGSSLEGLDLSWAEPDLGLGGLAMPLIVAEAEAEAAANGAGEARRAVRPAARAGVPGKGSVFHGTPGPGAAALAGKVPAGGAPQGLGLLAELAMAYQQARAGGAAIPTTAPGATRRSGEAQMRPASVTERERFVPGHRQVPSGSGVGQPGAAARSEGSRSRSESSVTAVGDAGQQLMKVGTRLEGSGIRQAPALPELTGLGGALADLAPGLDGASNPLAAWGSGSTASRPVDNMAAADRPRARASHPEEAAWPQRPGNSLLPPDWGGNWQPLYVAGEQADEAQTGEAWALPGDVAEAAATSVTPVPRRGPVTAAGLGYEGQPAIAPSPGPHMAEGYIAGPGGLPTAGAGMAPSYGAVPAPVTVPAHDLESVLGSTLASAVSGLPGPTGSPMLNWPSAAIPASAGAEGARQQVHLSMQVQLQGGQAAAAPAGEDLARRIKEILIAEARRHGIDL